MPVAHIDVATGESPNRPLDTHTEFKNWALTGYFDVDCTAKTALARRK